MESKKITQLATEVSPVLSDLTFIGDPITGQLKKVTLNQIAYIFGAGSAWGQITGVLSNQTDLQAALDAKVPYSGATGNVNLGEYGITSGYYGFDLTPTGTPTSVGTMVWDAFYRTPSVITGTGATTLQLGQEQVTLVHNNTGATLTEGQVVYVTGSTGELPSVALATNTTEAASSVTFGVVTESIPHGSNGFVTTSGMIHGLDTLAFTEGQALWLGATAGTFTNVKPVAPANSVLIGYVIKRAGGNGSIFVKIQNGYELTELHDILISGVTNNEGLFWDSATSLWKNKTIATALGYTPISLASLSATSPLSYNNATGNFSIQAANTSQSGYLTATDWNLFTSAYNNRITSLTTTGSSGSATLISNTLNVPTYTLVGLGGQPLLSGTGIVKSTAGTISYLTDNSTNWNTAYNDSIVSAAVTGTTTKTLTLTQKDAGTITASWTDINTDAVSSVFGRTGAIVAVSGDYNTDLVTEGSTNLYFTNARARAAISLTTTGSSGASTYVGGVLNVPNYTLAGLGGQPLNTNLTSLSGLSYVSGSFVKMTAAGTFTLDTNVYYLASNPNGYTTNTGTVTSVAALTLGTAGSDLSSTVANGSTTPVITLNVPTASAANRGALSAADWSTFNTKVGSVTASSPLASSGGSTPNITIQVATASQNGYLSSTDWTTFNNKQTAGNYITSLTGEATASGPGAAAVTLNNASVTAKVLTGVNITGGTIQATDTMLTAFGKLQNQINGLIGGSIYQGTWNASTNTPALASGVGTKGYYYIVSVAGSTNLDGITDWNVGDWAIFDGTAWQQVDNTDAVVSVNGQTGAVSLTTDNISEGATNKYFSNTLARAALSFTAGSGAYNSTTGVITIPTNTNQITNGANFITLASLSGTAPIVYSNTTGAISITQAGTASNGYLSSTDWNTFNNKQPAGSYVPTSRLLSINGTQYDLSADRSWSVGTVTSVAALTLGTSGTDLSSTVANSTTTPVITLNVPTASATNRGALSSADWTMFNNKQNALINPVTGTGTTNYLPKFTGTSTIGNSIIQDDGTNIGVGVAPSTYKLRVNGTGYYSGILFLDNNSTGQNSALRFNYNTGNVSSRNWQIASDYQAYGDFVLQQSTTQTGTIWNNILYFAPSGAATFSSSITANAASQINGLTQDAIQTIFTIQGYNAAAQSKGLYFQLTAGTPLFTIRTGATGADAGISIKPDGTNGLTIPYGTGAATFSSSVTANALNFSSVYSTATGDGITISSNGATAGSGNFGAGLVFTQIAGGSRRAAIAPVQGTADNDTVGLAFFTHPSATGSTDLVEQFRIAYNGAATFSSSVTATSYILTSNNLFTGGNNTGVFLTGSSSDYSWGLNRETAGLTLYAGSSAAPKMTITSGGNVGIGTSSPSAKLQIKQSTSNWYDGIRVFDGSSNTWTGIGNTGALAVIASSYDNTGSYLPLAFYTSDTERMRITSGGVVQIANSSGTLGTLVGSERLNVNGDIYAYGSIIANTGITYGGAVTLLYGVALTFNGTNTAYNVPIYNSGSTWDEISILGGVRMTTTTAGFIPPRMTTTQKNALTKTAGMIVYDTTSNLLQCWNGSSWNNLW